MANPKTNDKVLSKWQNQSKTLAGYTSLVRNDNNLKTAVVNKYNEKNPLSRTPASVNSDVAVDIACRYTWEKNLYSDILKQTAPKTTIQDSQKVNKTSNTDGKATTIQLQTEIPDGGLFSSPFDKRLSRLEVQVKTDGLYEKTYVPYSTEYRETTTAGYVMQYDTLKDKLKGLNAADQQKKLDAVTADVERMKKDAFHQGVPALQNQYALIRLYGSKGGALLVNKKNQRRWYEIDKSFDQDYNFASTPTTSSLIEWGSADPYGRTPYQFTDFAFAKYWKKIENNRLITLRRYPAPILDNLKFPGMEKSTFYGSGEENSNSKDMGSVKDDVAFAPMASAVTYFGGETGNTLNNIMKFTTGVLWEDAQAAIWEVTSDVPDNQSGIASQGLFPGIGKLAELLSVAGGGENYNAEYIMNKGILPPDPYHNGPYENRIMGPINRIDSVKKRKPGLDFKMDNLNIVFEYVARPVGGINPKAVLLDILSNFLVIGSASAVFFGGAHRFMSNPAKYPFAGNISDWYKGKPIEWSKTAIDQFAGKNGLGATAISAVVKNAKEFFSHILSGDFREAFGSLFTSGSAFGNLMVNSVAKKSAGQVPYLQGMRAILTGEPVGEWHLTIGNPLNPIAMIGNLICDGIDVEFNDELGPDDFPTEMKITVKLKHAMARDRDAIESIFNRGMGRIYTLPDSFLGSADYQTRVDDYTQDRVQTGYAKGARMGIIYQRGMDSYTLDSTQAKGSENRMASSISVWNRHAFQSGISENSNATASSNELLQSSYRSMNWIAARAMQ